MRSSKNEVRKAFLFSASDLALNHDGKLSENQQELLRKKRSKMILPQAIGVAVLVAVAGLVLVLGAKTLGALTVVQIIEVVVVFLIVLGVIAYGLWHEAIKPWRNYTFDLRDSSVDRVDGQVTPQPLPRGRTVRYTILVEQREFEVTERMMKAFQQDRRYRIYYAPNSRTVVSAEAIDRPG